MFYSTGVTICASIKTSALPPLWCIYYWNETHFVSLSCQFWGQFFKYHTNCWIFRDQVRFEEPCKVYFIINVFQQYLTAQLMMDSKIQALKAG